MRQIKTRMKARTRTITILLFALLTPLVGAQAALAAPAPVVLELFTSNGCSSCPPAYTLLRQLRTESPRRIGAPVIVLSEHVDYWNSLGWVDRYSDAQFTQRQRDYARNVFGSGRVYTPQLVINGRREMVGSHDTAVRTAIKAESGQASLPVSLKIRPEGTDAADVTVSVWGAAPAGSSTVWLALTEDGVVSHIGAGENSGRQLQEDGVVRVLKPIGTHPGGAQAARRYRATLPIPARANRDNLAVVAFVQQARSRVIVGAARAALQQVGKTVGQR